MLGIKDRPSLLIEVRQEHAPDHFDFWVVNGAWEGTFYNGYVTVHHPRNPHSSLDKVEILCDNQDRLQELSKKAARSLASRMNCESYISFLK